MKSLTLLALFALTVTGCSSITGVRRLPDGSTLAITSHRLFWDSEGIDFGVQDTNGLTVKLSVQKSTLDSAAIQAVAQGVTAGMVNGAVSAAK